MTLKSMFFSISNASALDIRREPEDSISALKKLSAMEKAQGLQDREDERGFPQLRYRGF